VKPSVVPPADLSERPVPPPLVQQLLEVYPDAAKRRGISGRASLRVRIDPDGRVRVTSLLSETFAGFGDACRQALLGSVWKPPRDRSGRVVATEVRYTCHFVVE
jgi:TonB family protein